ncbi:MAG: hypothetical protein NZ602_12885, partial [Thermoguttaceae bacterium]|nr:hypothetical protein [Thermoguttaceae bacterium]
IRDPTYWFLFNFALYLICRAVVETRIGLFLAGGATIGLAIYTRLEGLLLIVVLLGWMVYRTTALRQARWRVVLGTLGALGIIPAGVLVVNLTWLREHPQWEWGRLPLFWRIWNWTSDQIEQLFSSEPATSSQLCQALDGNFPLHPENKNPLAIRRVGADSCRASFSQPVCAKAVYLPGQLVCLLSADLMSAQRGHSAGQPLTNHCSDSRNVNSSSAQTGPNPVCSGSVSEEERGKVSEWVHARRVAVRMIKAISYSYAPLMGIGLVLGWRILLRADQIVLSIHNLLLFYAAWAYLSSTGGIDGRYLFPILMTGLPYAAIGFLATVDGLNRVIGRGQVGYDSAGRRFGTLLLGVVVLVGVSIPQVEPSATRLMRQQTALGRWIHCTLGPHAKIFGPRSAENLLAYHAQGVCSSWPPQMPWQQSEFRKRFFAFNPDVVLLWNDPVYRDRQWMEEVAQLCEQFGYQPVAAQELPEAARHVRVWIRGPRKVGHKSSSEDDIFRRGPPSGKNR